MIDKKEMQKELLHYSTEGKLVTDKNWAKLQDFYNYKECNTQNIVHTEVCVKCGSLFPNIMSTTILKDWEEEEFRLLGSYKAIPKDVIVIMKTQVRKNLVGIFFGV